MLDEAKFSTLNDSFLCIFVVVSDCHSNTFVQFSIYFDPVYAMPVKYLLKLTRKVAPISRSKTAVVVTNS